MEAYTSWPWWNCGLSPQASGEWGSPSELDGGEIAILGVVEKYPAIIDKSEYVTGGKKETEKKIAVKMLFHLCHLSYINQLQKSLWISKSNLFGKKLELRKLHIQMDWVKDFFQSSSEGEIVLPLLFF
jgi:hypothetical protein